MKAYKIKAIFWKVMYDVSFILNRPKFGWLWKYTVYKNAGKLVSAFEKDLTNMEKLEG